MTANTVTTDRTVPVDPRQLARGLQAYRTPHPVRSGWELGVTLAPFIALVAAILFAVDAGYWIGLLLSPLAGLLLLRLFIIQHDCGHGSFLSRRAGNDWIGRALGVLTFTPYDCWQRAHNQHHASTGNLDARGMGDVDTLTVREFFARNFWQRLGYRTYRNPLVLMGLGPAYLFLLRHRLPIGLMKAGAKYWVSAMGTNVGIALILAGLIWAFGIAAVAAVVIPVLLIAASMGVWLFYIQHQFEDAHWDKRDDWSFHDAALKGSSYLDLPPVLRWFTGDIGIHHVHHLASRIPFYRLNTVLKAYPDLEHINRYTLRQTFKPMLLALWDEEQRKMVTFAEAKRRAKPA